MSDLWVRCVTEAARCDLLIAYHPPNEQWKVRSSRSAQLAAHRPVYVIGQPPGSWTHHPLVSSLRASTKPSTTTGRRHDLTPRSFRETPCG